VVLTSEFSFRAEADLDAARLTLEVAAGSGAGNGKPPFSFRPPPGGGPPGGDGRFVYAGDPWLVPVTRTNNTVSAQQIIPGRGSATVTSRSFPVLGRMASTVRAFLRYNPIEDFDTREEFVDDMTAALEIEVRRLFGESPKLKEIENGTPTLRVILDQNALMRQIIVEIRFTPDGSSNVRVAAAE
jgi:hypothetical protein